MVDIHTVIEKFNNLKKREQYLIIGLLIAFVFSFYFRLVFNPLNSNIKKLKVEIKSVETKVSVVKTLTPQIDIEEKSFNELKIDYDKSRKKLYDLEDKLTNREKIPQILNELIKQGGSYSMDFISIKPKATKGKATYSKLEIEMKMGATYNNFVNYLYRLENISKFLKPESIELEEMKDGLQGDLKCKVILGTFLSERPAETTDEIKAPYLEKLVIDRNPFKSKLIPKKLTREKAEKKYKLQGVNWMGGVATAIINGEVYRVGEKVEEAYLLDILKKGVILKDKSGEEIILNLELEK